MSHSALPCDGCGCHCRNCNDHAGLHLHVEIENLKQRLLEKENYILSMETNFLREAEKFPNGEVAAISEELSTWQDKYSRLYEAHKRVQKVNQNLEDKLLRTVDKCETEKNALTNEVANLTRRLVDEKYNVARLQEENERYRNDVNLAIQLLQCKPSNFVSQKYDSLPGEMQQKVRNYISNKRRPSDGNGNIQGRPEMKTIKVPIPTYPPTAMVYSVNKGPLEKELNTEEKPSQAPVDIVSAAIMAKVLEEREKERAQTRHCETCTCPVLKCSKSVQTVPDSPSEKCSPASQVNKSGFNAMSVRNRLNDREKEKPLDYRPSHRLSKSDSSTKVTHTTNNNWEVDIDRLAVSRLIKTDSKKTKTDTVAEGILVNIDSAENSSVNSVTSDSSSISWPSKVGSAQNSEKQDSSETDLISFDKPVVSKSPNDDSKVVGPRHCSVRMQLGSNNILLDNIVDPFTPILYKSRNSDPLVHATRSRSGSSNSSCEEHAPPNSKIIFRTETEI